MLGGIWSGRPKSPPRITFDPGSTRCRTWPAARRMLREALRVGASEGDDVRLVPDLPVPDRLRRQFGVVFPEFPVGAVAEGRPPQKGPPGVDLARRHRFHARHFGEPLRGSPDEREDPQAVLGGQFDPVVEGGPVGIPFGGVDGLDLRPGERQPHAGDIGLCHQLVVGVRGGRLRRDSDEARRRPGSRLGREPRTAPAPARAPAVRALLFGSCLRRNPPELQSSDRRVPNVPRAPPLR